MFCAYCGKQLPDDAKFCSACGKPVAAVPLRTQSVQSAVKEAQKPEQKTVSAAETTPAPAAEKASGTVFSSVPTGKRIRVRCMSCGRVGDYNGLVPCPQCGTQPAAGGYLKLYRMGSPYGVASGFGIYVDNQPDGYIGNKQTCWVLLPYGTHNIHIAVGLNRKCSDYTVTVSPQTPVIGARVYLKPGFWTNQFVIEPYDPAAIPD